MEPNEYVKYDAVGLAELVRTRQVTPRELVQAAVESIEAGNGAINAVVYTRFEQALEEADHLASTSNAPLAGVPFLLKDGGSGQAGVPQTKGNIALKQVQHAPKEDTVLGRRFREAGLITLGVTNVPEFSQLGDTQPLAYGRTRNPWCMDRSASGSSGGAAAAVAAGFVPVAQGGDGAGSIRQPAGWCGVGGLKTSRGRVPRAVGPIDDIWGSELVLSRTVRDTAVVLDAVNGALPGDLYALPRPTRSSLDSLTPPKKSLRIGLMIEGPGGLTIDPECVRAVEETGALLQHAGHRVELTQPSAMLELIPDWVNRLRYHDIVRTHVEYLAGVLGRPVTKDDVEPTTWEWFVDSEPVSVGNLRASLEWHLKRSARLVEWWSQGFDLLVTPVVNQLPDLLEDLANQTPEQVAATERRHATFLEPFNASGQPAISLPIRRTDEGIPVGVQIAAARGEDQLLLKVAAQLEMAVGWSARRPNVNTGQAVYLQRRKPLTRSVER